MAHYVEESRTELGVVIPNSFLVRIGCDLCTAQGRREVVENHVSGFDDAMRAVRHLKGALIANEGWAFLEAKNKKSSLSACPRHRKEK